MSNISTIGNTIRETRQADKKFSFNLLTVPLPFASDCEELLHGVGGDDDHRRLRGYVHDNRGRDYSLAFSLDHLLV